METILKDQLVAEDGKREEAERSIAQLKEELKKHTEELKATKADSSVQK